jgi:hypothetical protein
VDTFPAAVTADAREPWVQPDRYQAWMLDHHELEAVLQRIPPETLRQASGPEVISLPMPDGSLARFAIYESPVLAAELAAKFPQIRTFVGQGLDDPAASVRFDWTPHGFHAQVLTPRGAVYVDPFWRGDARAYASYWKRDLPRRDGFSCVVRHHDFTGPGQGVAAQASSSGLLRTYRLACAATGEYTQFHGGTVAAGLAAIVTAVNRVNGIYETDFGIRMVLVPNNDQVVYTNPATDPYTNGDGGAMLTQNQSTLNSVIGSANYDIGHVVSTGGGGVAFLGVVCNGLYKARGVTGLPSPIGDPFYVDYVAHEMGHQFGANHTFNGISSNCCCGNRYGPTAYEPGSGSSIMAYAGICGADNLQPNSDPFFHSASITEITNYTRSGFGSSCAQLSSTGNAAPVVDAGSDYVIPALTPFELTADADDPDGDSLTYSWEQRDLGVEQTLASADNGSSPILRAWNPTSNPTRVFPRLSNLLTNTLPAGEKLPALNRNMDFRVVARDHRAGGGEAASDDMLVVVTSSAGPFAVTFPNSGSVFSWREVLWNPAGTAAAPVAAGNVDILLSTDGGLTFPVVLAAATPNDGKELVEFPDTPTSTARLKIKATNNIFFDISNNNLSITACTAPATPLAEASGNPKNRFISFTPGNGGKGIALRVVLADLPPSHASLIGEERWVGPPQTYMDTPAIGNTIWAASLQCEPFIAQWDNIPVLHVFGPEIVPDAVYEVQTVHCAIDDVGRYSPPLIVPTAKWGDVGPAFHPSGSQPDVIDIAYVVDRVKTLPSAVSKVYALTQPAEINPASDANVIDIGMVVNAIKGFAYPFSGPPSCPP